MAISTSAAYDEHGAALRQCLGRYTRDASAAEDLAHEAFVRLLIESSAGRPPTNVRAWLFRVGTNLATSRARRQGVAARRAGELVPRRFVPSPEELLIDREERTRLTGLLDGLPDHVRVALLLSAEGYSGAEIARTIGRSELATRSLLCRQRSRLRSSAAA